MEEYQMTPKQYYKNWIDSVYKENHALDLTLTKKEIIDSYPFESVFYDQYLPMLYRHAREGRRIPDRVLDKLTPGERHRFLHDYPDMYRDYLPPEVRRQKREIYTRRRVRG